MTLRHLTKVVSLVPAMSVMASFSLWALVQKIDYTPEQYEAYNKCPGLTDPEAKQQCVLDFIEEHPKLSLVEYAIAEYGRALQDQIQKGQHEQVVTAGEAMLKYRPDEIKLITQLCYSAYNCGQYAKAAKYGELAYASNPAAGFIQILADAYQKTGNKEKHRCRARRSRSGGSPRSVGSCPHHRTAGSAVTGISREKTRRSSRSSP